MFYIIALGLLETLILFSKSSIKQDIFILKHTICKFADASWAGDNVRTIEITRTSNRATP